MTRMPQARQLTLRVDRFAEWRQSGSPLPFDVWLREEQARARTRQQGPVADDRSAVSLELALVVAIVVVCVGASVGVIGRAAGIW